MAEIYFKDINDVTYTDEELKMIVLDKYVNDFPTQTLVQDEIPYSNQKVTYCRKKEKRKLKISFVFDISSYEQLRIQIMELENIIYLPVKIGFYDEGYEYECNLTSVSQENIKRYIRKYTFIFETTTPDKTLINSG